MSTVLHPSGLHLGRLGSALAVGALALGLTAATVAAQAGPPASSTGQPPCTGGSPALQLANPSPGDVLATGDYVVSGTASETGSISGDTITRVDLFLGHRDAGGLFLGSAVPGQSASSFTPGSLLAMTSFSITTTLPSSSNGEHDFVAYASSSANGQETSVSVPVFIGAPPVPTPHSAGNTSVATIPLTSTTTSTACATGAAAASATPLPSASVMAQPTGSVLAQPASSAIAQMPPLLVVSNPTAGDLLGSGDVVIQGLAYDPAATQGSGVDRVELFLGSRDSGGVFLGSGMPGTSSNPFVADQGSRLAQAGFAVRATVPTNLTGNTTLFAYAHSSVTGQEVVVSIPINVGAPPSPTPRPA